MEYLSRPRVVIKGVTLPESPRLGRCIVAPIRSMLSEQENCKVLMKEVDDIHLADQTIVLGGEPYTYDYLVLASGMETNCFGNEAWKHACAGAQDDRRGDRRSGTPLGEKLRAELDKMGRVVVEPDLTVAGHPNVFVVGDLAHCADPETGELVPDVAQGATQGGKYAGGAIAAEPDSRLLARPSQPSAMPESVTQSPETSVR